MRISISLKENICYFKNIYFCESTLFQIIYIY